MREEVKDVLWKAVSFCGKGLEPAKGEGFATERRFVDKELCQAYDNLVLGLPMTEDGIRYLLDAVYVYESLSVKRFKPCSMWAVEGLWRLLGETRRYLEDIECEP